MAGTRCLPACSTALAPLAVWGLARRSRQRSARLLPPVPPPQAPLPLSLQLLLQLIEEAPVRALRNDLLGACLDHARLMQAQGVEPQRVLGVILAPRAVWQLLQRLHRVVIVLGNTFVNKHPGHALRLLCAQRVRFQNGAHRTL